MLVFQNPYTKIDMFRDCFWVHDPRYPCTPFLTDSFGEAIMTAMKYTLVQHKGVY